MCYGVTEPFMLFGVDKSVSSRLNQLEINHVFDKRHMLGLFQYQAVV